MAGARPWLYGIATKLVRSQRRAERRLLSVMARLGPDETRSEEEVDAVVARAQAAVIWPALLGALASLDDGQRDVLVLQAWADLGYQEIAQALDIPLGTVRSRLSRARAQLRHELGSDRSRIGPTQEVS